ncbi:MAG: helix-turn-helix transcriptional regulator [Desulfocapsaceae bacterium]|nr:helix-turn-helix transcriptional regulator [Desulfocapsaceae bacterium]
MEGVELYKKVLNAMSTHVAILDENGEILETNRAWIDFGKANGLAEGYSFQGRNYFKICGSGSDRDDNDGAKVANGIRKVISGDLDEFLMQYPCHSPTEQRWFAIRVVAYRESDVCRVIVSHENITPIVEIQKDLEKKEEELQKQANRLEETNTALRVLLDQRNEDKKRLEAAVFANVDRLVLPYIEKLGNSRLNDHQKTLVEIANSNLQELVSPFLQQLSALEVRLTPQEIEIAHLIRKGKSSKEIADILFLSVAGVDFHRKNLRRKLGLTHSNRNLRTFLMALQ